MDALNNLKIVNNVTPIEVKNFINQCGESLIFFRYFEKRPFEIIKNHIQTALLFDLNNMVGYGHLEKEDNKIWLGIVLSPDNTGKGYGKYLMEYIINFFLNTEEENLYLTVDIKNKVAIKLFEKSGFRLESTINSRSYLMKLNKSLIRNIKDER